MKKAMYVVVPIVIMFLLLMLILSGDHKFKLKTIQYCDLNNTLKDKNEYILYTSSIENSTKSQLLMLYERYGIETYNCNMQPDEIREFLGDLDYEVEDTELVILKYGGEIQYITAIETPAEELFEQYDKYILGIIPVDERYYKEVSAADEFLKKVYSNDYTVAVFGKESCSYCTLYLPVVNKIAQENSLDIYYFDADNFDEEEYKKITALDYTIPAKCTTTGLETSLSAAFPKPMTIITKKGEYVDCIKGYVTEDEVLDVLSKYKIVKEK